MKSSFLAATVLLLAALFLVGCEDSTPPGPSMGSLAVTKYVSVGNSLTAGYQSNGLYASAQMYSFPNLIATQLKAAGSSIGNFEQPLYGDPGNADPATGKAARYELISFTGPVIGPRGVAAGTPTNTALARPYDNLGLPGAPLAGFMDTVGTYQGSFGPALILRWGAGPFPKSQYLQVRALNPDLITFWLGANDVLGFATSGGVSPSTPTPDATFGFLYNQALDTLRKTFPTAKIVVANVPEVTAIPFFTTVGPSLKAKLGSVLAAGYVYYQKRGETGAGTGATKFNETVGQPLVTLIGGRYATLVGTATYAPWRGVGGPYASYATAQALGLDSTKPFGLHPQNPFPSAYVLDSLEQTLAATAIAGFNTTISNVAAAKGAKVVDIHGIFNDIVVNGYKVSGQTYTSAYVTGGLFSLDGVHPSNRGHGIMANEFIRVINREFGASIPPVNVAGLPGLPAPLTKGGLEGIPGLPETAERSMRELFRQSNE